MVSLLERRNTWRVKSLFLFGEVGGQTWERLGREVARGRIEYDVLTETDAVRRTC